MSRLQNPIREHNFSSRPYLLSHLSKMKLSHVFLNVRLRYMYQLPIDANLVLYPTTSIIDSNTCMDNNIR